MVVSSLSPFFLLLAQDNFELVLMSSTRLYISHSSEKSGIQTGNGTFKLLRRFRTRLSLKLEYFT